MTLDYKPFDNDLHHITGDFSVFFAPKPVVVSVFITSRAIWGKIHQLSLFIDQFLCETGITRLSYTYM